MYNRQVIFKDNIYKLFQAFDKLNAYIDALLVITKDNFTDHPKALGELPQKIDEAGLKVNEETSLLRQT